MMNLARFIWRPIRVFCLHHVSKSYNPAICHRIDWTPEDEFKRVILEMKSSYDFISLSEAWTKINTRRVLFNQFAVLTFDDGYSSILPVLSWLEHQGIPYTLFINGKYLDGMSYHPGVKDWMVANNVDFHNTNPLRNLYLTYKDLMMLSPYLCSIASHGYEHIDATAISQDEFEAQIFLNQSVLQHFANYVHFHAYTWGNHNNITDCVLKRLGLVPVLIDGQRNIFNSPSIHRELFPHPHPK